MTNIPSIQYASTEAASANASTTLVHASKLITELRLREDKIEALERRNQELITLRDSLLAMTADHAVPLHDVAKSSQIARLQHLEMQSRQQELELAALHSKYSEALNYLGECLETIENLHDDMDSMRTVMQQQSEALAQHKCSSVHINTTKQSVSKGPPSSFPHLGKSTPRHLSCDSAFEWPLNDSCHESEQGGNSCASSMTYEVQIVECSSLVECDAKPSLEQQVAKLLVGADKAVGAYHQSCFLPFLF